MFYCDRCKRKNKYLRSFQKSFCKCEICGKERVCNNTPSKNLLNDSEKEER